MRSMNLAHADGIRRTGEMGANHVRDGLLDR